MKMIIRMAVICSIVLSCGVAKAVDPKDLLINPSIEMVKAHLVPLETIEEIPYYELLDMLGYESIADCNADVEFAIDDSDVDGDGIPDYVERSITKQFIDGEWQWVHDPWNQDCNCADNLTCWLKYDTDGDGIKDGADNFGIYWPSLDVTEPTIVSPGESDDDGVPDVLDCDSDDDGLLDGQEDRSTDYSQDSESVFYIRDVLFVAKYENFKGDEVSCDLMVNNDIGIRHAYYIIKRYGSIVYEGILSCSNKSVAALANFNGMFEIDTDTSNARDVDTDGDGFCDGDGPGCEGLELNDSCPTQIAAPDSTDGC